MIKKLTLWLCEYILKNNKKVIGVLLVLTALLGLGLTKLQKDFTHRVWFPKNSVDIKTYDKFIRTFGNDDTLVIVISAKENIFQKKYFEVIHHITEDSWKIPHIISVDSITNHGLIFSNDDTIKIESIVDENKTPFSKLSDEYFKKFKDVNITHKSIGRYLVNSYRDTVVVHLKIKPSIDEKPNYKETLIPLEKLVSRYQKKYPDIRFTIAGTAHQFYVVPKQIEEDFKLIIPIMIIGTFLIILLLYKSFFAATIPFIIVALTYAATMGASGLLGFPINPISSMIPGIIVAISVADSLHFLNSYSQFRVHLNVQEANYQTLLKNLLPTFLTSFTTSIGFFSLMVSEVNPIKWFGFAAGLGSFWAWFLSVSIIPFLLGKYDFIRPKEGISKFLFLSPKGLIRLTERHAGKILFLSIALIILGLNEARKNKIDSNYIETFPKDHPYVESVNFIDKKFGGTRGVDIVLRSYDESEDGVLDPKFLKKLEKYQERLQRKFYVTKTRSIIDIIKELNMYLNNGDKNFYKIPDTKEEVSQLLFLYELTSSPHNSPKNFVSNNHKEARVNVLWTLRGSTRYAQTFELFEEYTGYYEMDGEPAGKAYLLTGLNEYLVITFGLSILFAIGFISLFMMIVLKSIWLGLLAMLPNILPIAITSGLMYHLGISIHSGSVLVASVCLGIAVDDTTHFLNHFIKEEINYHDLNSRIEEILRTTGNTLIITTLTLVFSFGSFSLATIKLNSEFGILTAISLSIALIADLVVLPSCLHILARAKKATQKKIF